MARMKFTGVVNSIIRAHEGTLKVKLTRSVFNSKYQKSFHKIANYCVHFDKEKFKPSNFCIGTVVVFTDCAPVSKTKKHIVIDITGNNLGVKNV